MKREPLFQHLLHKSQCLFGLARSLTENHEVIGITNKPVTRVIQLPVQMVQNNICQERRNHAALWCADRRRFKHAIVHHPRREKLFDQTENVAIGHPFSQRLHNDGMHEVIEKSLDVGVHDVAEAVTMEFQSRLDRHMAGSFYGENHKRTDETKVQRSDSEDGGPPPEPRDLERLECQAGVTPSHSSE